MKRVVIAMVLLCAACGSGVQTSAPVAQRVIATPEPTGRATVTVSTGEPTAVPARPRPTFTPLPPKAVAAPALAVPAPAAGVGAFRQLGAWIDVFDYDDDPDSVLPLVRGMEKEGTKTLYLETARYSTPGDFDFPKAMGAALDEAKRLGLRVVAWYPPDFADVAKDVKRSLAAIRYRSPTGNRFDAFAADIEYTAGVPDHAKRSKLTVDYGKRLRAAAGPTYPLAAIVIPPSWLERTPSRWPDFPWSSLGATYDVIMPMEYWTALGKDPKTAYDVTLDDVRRTKALTARPVHIIGGLGADADGPQTDAYVKAAKQAGSIGGEAGLYDYRTTRSDVWDELRKLNT